MASAVSSAAIKKSVRTSVILPEDAHTRIQALAEAKSVLSVPARAHR
jgi:hypothetical protein